DTHFGAGDSILELNCGTGEDALHLARRGARVLATDISATMVQVAREKIALLGMGDLVEVRQMAIEEMPNLPDPFPPASRIARQGRGSIQTERSYLFQEAVLSEKAFDRGADLQHESPPSLRSAGECAERRRSGGACAGEAERGPAPGSEGGKGAG